MQTQAEKQLISAVAEAINNHVAIHAAEVAVLNIGAGTSSLIEGELANDCGSAPYAIDRIDIEPCSVNAPHVRASYTGTIESLPFADASYDIAFANYVFEHVSALDIALAEVRRILKPSGRFIISVPNPSAPEFIISKHTPQSFHDAVRGPHETAFETAYAYASISDLIRRAEKAGFTCVRARRSAALSAYAGRFIILKPLMKAYDVVISALHLTPLMGQVCLEFSVR